MLFINSVLFIVFCLAGLYFLFNEGRMIHNPLIKKQDYFATGPQIFFILSIATGMCMLGEYNSTRLFIWIVFMAIGVFVAKGGMKFSLALIFYILYILYLFASLFVTPDKWYGIRVIAKYLYPLLVLLFAAKVTDSEFVVFSGIKYLLIMGLFIEISYIFWLPWTSWGVFWIVATFADHLSVLCVIALALFYATSKKKYLYLLLFFFSYSVISAVRTGLIGITVSLIVFFIVKYKWKAMPVVVLVFVAAIFVVLYVPGVRDKMFRKQMTAEEIVENRENLSMKDIDNSGRQAMWDWSLENYYQNNKIYGSGIGNLQMVFYSDENPFAHPVVHNDYVQILCDTGLVGLSLFLLIAICLVVHTFFIYNNKQNNQAIRLCAIVAGSSLVGILATSYTDNAVNYSLATYFYPYAFYGMALGLMKKYNR